MAIKIPAKKSAPAASPMSAVVTLKMLLPKQEEFKNETDKAAKKAAFSVWYDEMEATKKPAAAAAVAMLVEALRPHQLVEFYDLFITAHGYNVYTNQDFDLALHAAKAASPIDGSVYKPGEGYTDAA